MKKKKSLNKILHIILYIIIFLFFQNCNTTETISNEMKFIKDKILFSFIINNKKVEGYIESQKGKYDINAKINNNILAGEISYFSNRLTYSIIYKNEFVKGFFDYYLDKQTCSANFQILNKKLNGEILFTNNRAMFNLVYNNNPIKGSWVYNPEKSSISWNISFNNKESIIIINEKNKKSLYSFNEVKLEDDEIIIFLILEILRMNK